MTASLRSLLLWVMTVGAFGGGVGGAGCLAAEDAVISAAKTRNGILIHEVQSPYQSATTLIRVLLPDQIPAGSRLPTVYVLPVEAGVESRYGDGLEEVRSRNLHNELTAVFVAPTFSQLPWYADHPEDSLIRQESHFLAIVVPFIERSYSVKGDGTSRYLLGFSKSGWGAWTLLLRHPEMFHRAAAWDAPLMMDAPGRYGSGPIFKTQANFDGYRVKTLLSKRSEVLQDRFVLTGFGNFRADHVQTHDQLEKLQIRHDYEDGPQRKHDWHSGWVAPTTRLLLKPVARP